VPQLAKGGKHAFGWSQVGSDGDLAIPPEALAEYRLLEDKPVLLVPGSRTSGGFAVTTPQSLAGSALARHPELTSFQVPEGTLVESGGKPYCWVSLRAGRLHVPPDTLARYGVRPGDRLLVIRGSGLAVGFAVRGRIVEQARSHPCLSVFE
jgi:hypothetical protein